MEIALQTRGDYASVLRAARWAEERGLTAFAVPDHYLGSSSDVKAPAWDHLVHLAGLARETSTIHLVDLVSPVTFRHPAVHAKMAATIHDMAGGRFTFGLGTGWMAEEHSLFGFAFPSQRERFELLEEQFGYLRALSRGEGFVGKHYQLEEFTSAPRFEVPLLTGGTGPDRTPALAGRYCDELNLFPRAPDDLAQRIEVCRGAARSAGRDPAEIRLSFTAVPIAGIDNATYQTALAAAAEESDRTPEVLEERLTARGVPFGTPDRIQTRLAELAALGITRLYLQAGTTDPSELEAKIRPFLPFLPRRGEKRRSRKGAFSRDRKLLGEGDPVGGVESREVVRLDAEVGDSQQLAVDNQVAEDVTVLGELAGRAEPGTINLDRH